MLHSSQAVAPQSMISLQMVRGLMKTDSEVRTAFTNISAHSDDASDSVLPHMTQYFSPAENRSITVHICQSLHVTTTCYLFINFPLS